MSGPPGTKDADSGGQLGQTNSRFLNGTTHEDVDAGTSDNAIRRLSPDGLIDGVFPNERPDPETSKNAAAANVDGNRGMSGDVQSRGKAATTASTPAPSRSNPPRGEGQGSHFQEIKKTLQIYGGFIGPGFMVAVAYIDPGNYSTGVAAGASYQFALLFIVLLSNIIAIFLQSLCIKLGTVSGMNLAQMSRAHFPKWLNWFLYILAEGAIIATDIAEVIGTAIAINLLIPQIPLVAGCAISILDVLLILIFYRPAGSIKGLRAFELFVTALVLGVVVCFCIQLSLIKDASIGKVFRGYLPSGVITESNGLYQACGILGATVMPHSLYLGSGIVQPRLLAYDIRYGHVDPTGPESSDDSKKTTYLPSLSAINFSLKHSIVELGISLFSFALFVNSAILITAGASLYGVSDAEEASLFSIHKLLSTSISPAAGTIFALALLLSGVSAGIVCTIAGQMVSEGALNWTISPWLRRLITRCISITPSIIIAGAVGKDGLTAALNGSQVALSVALPFISAPIIYFTCRNRYMTVSADRSRRLRNDNDGDHIINDIIPQEPRIMDTTGRPAEILQMGATDEESSVSMRNHWITTTIGIILWLVVTVLNVANIVLLGLGK